MVLAIIALIAVPIVLNIIENARKGAAIASARGYIKAVETYIVSSELDKDKKELIGNNKYNVTTTTTIDVKMYQSINDLVEVKGSLPIGIEDYITLGNSYQVVEAKLTINGYEMLIKNNELVSITKGKIIDVESIILDKENVNIGIDETVKLEATILPDNASNKIVTWTSSDESIATVDSNGLVTGLKYGNTIITVKASNGKTATANIAVEDILTNVISIGDYVAYDAGKWTSSAALPTSQGQFGGYTKGQNKASSVIQCNNDSKFGSTTLKGWRVLNVDKNTNTVIIIHAGQPECYYHAKGYSAASVTNLNNRATSQYLNDTYASSAHMMNKGEADVITQSNNLRTTGSYYWMASPCDSSNLFNVSFSGGIGYGSDKNYSWGVRPVVVLRPNIKTTGIVKDAVGNDAWSLVAP